MKTTIVIVLLFVLSVTLTIHAADQYTQKFSLARDISGSKVCSPTLNTSITVTAVSRLQCGSRCTETRQCASFTFYDIQWTVYSTRTIHHRTFNWMFLTAGAMWLFCSYASVYCMLYYYRLRNNCLNYYRLCDSVG